jgi:hypothetical protein
MADALRIARIRDRRRSGPAQPQMLIELTQQQQAAVAAEVSTGEIGFDNAPTIAPEIDLRVRTLWHRQSSVVIGGQSPMSTRLGTRLPTYLW